MEEKTPDDKYGYSVEDDDSIIYAIDIVEGAYEKGFIDWNIYKKAMDRIRTNLNGSWMFEQETAHNTRRFYGKRKFKKID